MKSKTGKPNFQAIDDEGSAYLVDCPGFFDTNKEVEYPNAYAIRQVILHAKSVKICIIIDCPTLEINRGADIFKIYTRIFRMLKAEPSDYESFVKVYINKAHSYDSARILSHKLGGFKEMLKKRHAGDSGYQDVY